MSAYTQSPLTQTNAQNDREKIHFSRLRETAEWKKKSTYGSRQKKTYCKIDSFDRADCKAFIANIASSTQYLVAIHAGSCIFVSVVIFRLANPVAVPIHQICFYSTRMWTEPPVCCGISSTASTDLTTILFFSGYFSFDYFFLSTLALSPRFATTNTMHWHLFCYRYMIFLLYFHITLSSSCIHNTHAQSAHTFFIWRRCVAVILFTLSFLLRLLALRHEWKSLIKQCKMNGW